MSQPHTGSIVELYLATISSSSVHIMNVMKTFLARPCSRDAICGMRQSDGSPSVRT